MFRLGGLPIMLFQQFTLFPQYPSSSSSNMFAHIGLCTHTAHIIYVMMNNTVFGYLPNAYHLIYEMWSMSNAHSIINQMTSAFKWILMLFWRYLNLKFEQRHTMIHTWFYGYFLDFGQREIWPVDGFLFHFLFLTFFHFLFVSVY